MLGVAEAEHYDVFVAEQGASALEVGDQVGTASGDKGEVHRGGLAGWFGLGLVEVGVAVQEQQAVAAAASEGEADAEQDGAVAAEHDREGALVEDGADGVGEPGRVVAQAVGVEQARAGIDARVERREGQPGSALGAEPLGESGRQEGLGQGLDPGSAQAGGGRALRRSRGPAPWTSLSGSTDASAKTAAAPRRSARRANDGCHLRRRGLVRLGGALVQLLAVLDRRQSLRHPGAR